MAILDKKKKSIITRNFSNLNYFIVCLTTKKNKVKEKQQQ